MSTQKWPQTHGRQRHRRRSPPRPHRGRRHHDEQNGLRADEEPRPDVADGATGSSRSWGSTGAVAFKAGITSITSFPSQMRIHSEASLSFAYKNVQNKCDD